MVERVNFDLNEGQLADVALALENRIIEGLNTGGMEIQCLPTYVPVNQIPQNGQSLVLDIGGSNVRSAIISFNSGIPRIEKGPLETVMPWKRNLPFDKKAFLGIQTRLLAALEPPYDLPLGYCFSFPAESAYNRDAKLIHWTKEIFVPNTEGKLVGKMLSEEIQRDKTLRCSNITVINDTIASLFSGFTGPESDAYIGLIVGTGTNMATFMDSSTIPKLSDKKIPWEGALPVNLESGNFTPPYLTRWDKQLDSESENSGHNRLEKAVSGVYLGRLFKSVFPESDFDPSSGASGLSKLLEAPSSGDRDQILVARQIYDRSAKLIAASLAGLVKVLDKTRSRKNVRIVAEGGLFWAALKGESYYADLTKTSLQSLLSRLGLPHVTVELKKIENANLIGSALAALAK